MSNTKMFAVVLLTATAISSAAFAADRTANQSATGQSAADHDFTKLSTDGLKAFQDVRLARVAIFDGQTKQAKTYVNEAKAEIAKAETDNTAFTKAESDIKTPSAMAKPDAGKTAASTTPASTTPASTTPASTTPASTTPIAWIPVDGALTLDEDYTATPEKAKGVAAANEKLKNGQSKEAMDALKLAQIDAIFVTELAPMKSTVNGIDKAAQLVDEGQYYQANQQLKAVEDGVRFDAIDMTDQTKGTSKSMKTAATATPAAAPSGK